MYASSTYGSSHVLLSHGPLSSLKSDENVHYSFLFVDLDPSEGTVFIVIPVVVLGVALLCVVGAVVFMRRRRRR